MRRQTQTTYADINNCIVRPDGVIGEHVVFIKQHEDIDHALKVVPSCQLPILDILLTGQYMWPSSYLLELILQLVLDLQATY